MKRKNRDEAMVTVELHDLEDRATFAGIVIVLGLAMVLFGVTLFRRAIDMAIDQRQDLEERLDVLKEKLHSDAPKPSESELPKT